MIDQIKSRLDHLALFSRFVRLKKAGRKYSGLCPFHKERSPSFSVDPELGLYYCFGCGKGGDSINFLMELEGLTFWEVVKDLAAEAGVALPERTPEAQVASGNRERALMIYAAADEFYRAKLHDSPPVLAYLEKRHLTLAQAEQFGLGYAPEGWGNLRDHLTGKGYSDAELREYGLVTGETGRNYDRFRDRLIFPIRDVKARPVAFGGRSITPENEPKYLNSPDTILYKKSEVLYGLDQARGPMRERDLCVIVEGYMDRIALARAGVACTVAGCGTALTPEQVKLIARYTRRAVLFYDSDTAGQNATRKALLLLLPENFQVSIATTPAGKDADDLLNSGGPEAVQECLRNAVPFWPWFLGHLAAQHDLRQPQAREKYLGEALDVLRRVPGEVARRSLIAPLAEKLDIPEGVVMAEMRKRPGESGHDGAVRQALKGSLTPSERLLWHLLLESPPLVRVLRELAQPDDLEGLFTGPALLELLQAEEEPDAPFIQRVLIDAASPAVLSTLSLESAPATPENLRVALSKIQQNRLKYASRQLDRELLEAQAAGRTDQVNEILKKRLALARQVQD